MKTPTTKTLTALGATALTLLPTLALAHTGVDGHTHGLAQGFLHPITGIDHVLAMVMVGVLAWRMGAAALWQLPVAFVVAMAIGGALGMAGLALPAVESAIALTVLLLGLLVVVDPRLPAAASVALVAVFALFHGFAHGAEQPAGASALGYAAGFLLATALLHATGLGLGATLSRVGRPGLRAAGAAASVAGLALVLSSL